MLTRDQLATTHTVFSELSHGITIGKGNGQRTRNFGVFRHSTSSQKASGMVAEKAKAAKSGAESDTETPQGSIATALAMPNSESVVKSNMDEAL